MIILSEIVEIDNLVRNVSNILINHYQIKMSLTIGIIF